MLLLHKQTTKVTLNNFRDDLLLGHKNNPWYKQMESVCLGDRAVNTRACEPESGLSVESEVTCLMDHAMDPNVLGRTYQGWEPWMWGGQWSIELNCAEVNRNESEIFNI